MTMYKPGSATIYPPYVIERSSRGEKSYDVFSRLLMDRIVFLGAPINDDVANIVIAQLLFLDADNPDRDIFLYINSPGGVISSGMAIYDTMQFLRAPWRSSPPARQCLPLWPSSRGALRYAPAIDRA